MNKKILMISHSCQGGGAEEVFFQTAKILSEINDIFILIPGKKGILYDRVLNENYRYKIIYNFGFNKKLYKTILRFLGWNVFSYLNLLNLKKNNYDFIYNSSITNYLGCVLSMIFKVKLIWHIHEKSNAPNDWINKNLDFIVRYFFKKSKLIFISNEVKSSWLLRLNLCEEEIDYEIIYNPLKEIKYDKSLKNKGNKILIGCVGTFCENKNQKLLIETFIKLQNKYKNIYLCLAGKGVIDGAKKLIKNRISNTKIELNDYEVLDKFYSKLDIIVVPSFSESFSLVAFEAMNCEVIPVLTNKIGSKDILQENKNTIYINPLEKNDLYKKLEYLIKNYDLVKNEIIYNNYKLLEKYEFNKNYKNKISYIFNF